jgi:hypothetical protein
MSAMERQYDVGGEVGRGQWGVVYSATRRRASPLYRGRGEELLPRIV